MTIYGIVGRLDIKEGNNRMVTMAEEVGVHQFMETESLIKGTTPRTETTLSEIKGRRESVKKRSKGELKKLAKDRGKGDWTVV